MTEIQRHFALPLLRVRPMHDLNRIIGTFLFAISLSCHSGCQKSDAQSGVLKQEKTSQSRRGENEFPATNISVDSSENEKRLQKLKKRFTDKTDDEIIQILRDYVPADTSQDKGMRWLTKRLAQAQKQHKAVETIKKSHGGIFYDYQKGSSICRPEGEPRAPEWLRQLLPEQFFVEVIGASLHGQEIANESLAVLQSFPNLEFFMLFDTEDVDDNGLVHLTELPRLDFLEVRKTTISKTSMEKLLSKLPDKCAVDWNGAWLRPPERHRFPEKSTNAKGGEKMTKDSK